MLGQMSNSSKRLEKFKKYGKQSGGSGFEFLMQSLDRDKENHMPNAFNTINYGQLSQSVNIDSQVTVPFSHIPKQETKNKKGGMFIENVKILDCSDLSISEVSEQPPQGKKPTKKYYNHGSKKQSVNQKNILKHNFIQSKQLQKSYNTIQDKGVSFIMEKDNVEELTKKVKQYLRITQEAFLSQEFVGKGRSKVKVLGNEIKALIGNIEVGQNDFQLKERKSQPRMMMKSEIITHNDSEDYLKVISQLQSQRNKLRGLVSEHELANIKLFVKMNDGESEEIQKCKRQLVLLFGKYKELEKLCKKDKKRIEQFEKQKSELVQKYQESRKQNKEILSVMEQMQRLHEKSHKKSSSDMAFQELVSQNGRSSVQFRPQKSIYQNSSNSRCGELQIQSLRNSRCSDFNIFGSSAVTSHSKISTNKRGIIGINLNALVESIEQDNLKRFMQEPHKLKKIIEECRMSIINLQSVICEQNKQLELSIKLLEQNQQKIKQKDNQILKLEERFRCFQLQCKGQKANKKENMNQKDKTKVVKLGKNSKKESDSQQTIKINESISNDLIPTMKNIDEYRIIATQAQALEKYLTGIKKK